VTERADSWEACASLWLESRQADSTRRTYSLALSDLLESSQKGAAEITRTDVIRWIQDLKGRGLSPATIVTRLAGISSFYSFAMEEFFVSDANGDQVRLGNGNPAAVGKSMKPRVQSFGKSTWLSAEETQSLLRAIKQTTLRGKRDYALFLGYILMGRRNSEWRQARWGDFKEQNGHIVFIWSGKGKTDQRLEVPHQVWDAIREYVKAAGKSKSIKVDDYIFTPLRVKQMPGGRRVLTGHPISSHEVGRLLKRYAFLAGLEPESIHPHSLRHTAAMLQRQVGASPESTQRFLGHRDLGTTSKYLHAIEGQVENHYMNVTTLLGLDL
jgi:integrase/recombinase XerD